MPLNKILDLRVVVEVTVPFVDAIVLEMDTVLVLTCVTVGVALVTVA